MVIKVEFKGDIATLSTKDEALVMRVPAAVVRRRFAQRERVGYFSATRSPDGSIELADRVPNEAW
jgi:hypothetical protein